MVSSVSGTGTISSAGIGSGLDVNSIVSKLMSIEQLPIDAIDNKSTVIQAQLTAYGTLQGSLAAFQTAAQALTNPSAFTASTTSVGDSTILTATTDATAAVGSHDIEVVQLGKSEKLQSATFATNTDSIGSGSLTIDFGTYTTASGVTTFAENTSKKSVTFTIPSGSSSIGAIASAINASTSGVNASVINDGTNYYLQFSAQDGGSANSLRITVSDDDGNNLDASGLSRLAFDKTSGYSSGSVVYTTPANVPIDAISLNNQFQIALDGAAPVTVTLPDANYSDTTIVAALQTAIDAAVGGGAAVKTLVSLNSSNQLVVSSKNTGSLSSVTLSAVTGNTGLTSIFGEAVELAAPRQMTEAVAPLDTIIKVDGITVTKTSNVITDAIQGVTLNLLKQSAAGVTTAVTIAKDTSQVSTQVNNLVTAYNSTASILSTLLAYDPTTGKSGALQGEGTVRTIQAGLRSTMQSLISGQSGLTSLSDIGVAFQRDGSLKFNSAKLQTILSDQTKNISNFFIGTDGDGNGIATLLNNRLNAYLDSGTGTFTARTSGLSQTISNYTKQKAALQLKMAAIEARYRKQFTNLDTLVASMNTTQNYLTQQLANLPGVVSSKK
ncbi:MAG: flagellar filament capping protein FliD [Sterolibacterium sp.]